MPVQVVNLSVRTVKMRSLNAVLFCQNLIRLCQRLFSQSAPGQPPPPEKVGKTEDHKKRMLGGELVIYNVARQKAKISILVAAQLALG